MASERSIGETLHVYIPLSYDPEGPTALTDETQWRNRIRQNVTSRQAWCMHPNPCPPLCPTACGPNGPPCRWEESQTTTSGIELRPDAFRTSVQLKCDLNALGARHDLSTLADEVGEPLTLLLEYRWSPDRPQGGGSPFLQTIARLPKTTQLRVSFANRPDPIAHHELRRMWAWLWATRPYTHHWYGDWRTDNRPAPSLLSRMQEVFRHPAQRFMDSDLLDVWVYTSQSTLCSYVRALHLAPYSSSRYVRDGYSSRRMAFLKPGYSGNVWLASPFDGSGLIVRAAAASDNLLTDVHAWWVDSFMRQRQIDLEKMRMLYEAIRCFPTEQRGTNTMAHLSLRNHSQTTAKPRVLCGEALDNVDREYFETSSFDRHSAQCETCNVLHARIVEREEDHVRWSYL